MIYLSLGLAAIAALVISRNCRQPVLLVATLILLLVQLFGIGLHYVADYLTGDGINESVLFHLKVGTEGAGYSEFMGIYLGVAGYFLVIGLFLLLCVRVARAGRSNSNVSKVRAAPVVLGMFLLAASFATNPALYDLHSLQSSRSANISIQPPSDYAITADFKAQNKKNLVFVYLESVERTFLDEDVFPGLMPRLAALERRAVTFTDMQQVFGTSWTIAGMVGSQCGVPLVTQGGGNTMGAISRFLPNAVCLGDILKQDGYHLEYMGGADSTFAGKGNFYKSHGFARVQGLDELMNGLSDPSYRSSWGLYDDSLFERAEKELLRLSEQSQPFGFFMLNLDTHTPNGHISKSCNQVKYQSGELRYLNAVHCTDKVVADFIETLLENDSIYDDTIIVVATDHFAMRNSATDMLEQAQRSNLFWIFDKDLKPATVARTGTTLDIGATVLSLLDPKFAKLGFGRSLLQSNSLAHQNGLSQFEEQLRDAYGYFLSLWDFPSVIDGFNFEASSGKARTPLADIDAPFMQVFDADLVNKGLYLAGPNAPPLLTRLTELDNRDSLVWVDECRTLTIFYQASNEQLPSDGLCVIFGNPITEVVHAQALPDNKYFASSRVLDLLERSEPLAEGELVKRQLVQENLVKFGVPSIEVTQLGKNLGELVVRSAGGKDNGLSFARLGSKNPRLNMDRGITAISINGNGQMRKVFHMDTCAEGWMDRLGAPNRLVELSHEVRGSEEHFVVVVADSADCGRGKPSHLLEGLGLDVDNRIGFRTPYIGIISPSGEIEEFYGQAEDSIVVASEY